VLLAAAIVVTLLSRNSGGAAAAGPASGVMAMQTASFGDHRIIAGIASTWAYCAVSTSGYPWCWHDNEGGYSALDLNVGPGDQSAHINVYHQEYGFQYQPPYGTLNTREFPLALPATTTCTGVNIEIHDEQTGRILGRAHYLHITPAPGVINGPSFVAGIGWTFLYLGQTVSTSEGQPIGCGFEAPHLHQSGQNTPETAVFTNWCIVVPPDVSSSCPPGPGENR